MSGVIWVIQVVHYPLFNRVGKAHFADYEAAHTRLISFVVIPPMLTELVTAFLLVSHAPNWFPLWARLSGLGLTLGVWLSTFFLSVPQHRQLSSGFDELAYRRLLARNWPRTLMWSLHSLLLLWGLAQGLRS